MLKLPNSIEPAVMAENIVHLRDGLAAVDAKTLPATTTATTGQILKLTGETKTPAWADEYSYTPPAYSETEVNTGQKWIDGKDVYCKVFTGTYPELTSPNQVVGTLDFDNIIKSDLFHIAQTNTSKATNGILFNKNNKYITVLNISSTFSEYNYSLIVYYTKPDPVPGDAKGPEDEEEPEEKKTTRKTKK